MTRRNTSEDILDVTERLVIAAVSIDDVSVRRIAEAAGVNVSAIAYHFGSRERLIVAVTRRVYDRLNAERLALLDRAVAAGAPGPPDLRAVIAALIGPSLRWSREAKGPYSVFVKHASLAQRSHKAEVRDALQNQITHLLAFVPPLRRAAPHLDDAEIGWRIHCALGVRDYNTRRPQRAVLLTGGAIDLDDVETVLEKSIDVIEPMFRP